MSKRDIASLALPSGPEKLPICSLLIACSQLEQVYLDITQRTVTPVSPGI